MQDIFPLNGIAKWTITFLEVSWLHQYGVILHENAAETLGGSSERAKRFIACNYRYFT